MGLKIFLICLLVLEVVFLFNGKIKNLFGGRSFSFSDYRERMRFKWQKRRERKITERALKCVYGKDYKLPKGTIIKSPLAPTSLMGIMPPIITPAQTYECEVQEDADYIARLGKVAAKRAINNG